LHYRKAPKERTVDYSTKEGLAEYVKFKFEQIYFGKHRTLVNYIELAQGLKLLVKKLRTGPNGKIMLSLKQVHPALLQVAESTYKGYQTFLNFMDEYPRFVHSELTFNQIKENGGHIKAWFKAQPAMGMDDFVSVNFWRYSLQPTDAKVDLLDLDEDMPPIRVSRRARRIEESFEIESNDDSDVAC
jgi:hypothetical protein